MRTVTAFRESYPYMPLHGWQLVAGRECLPEVEVKCHQRLQNLALFRGLRKVSHLFSIMPIGLGNAQTRTDTTSRLWLSPAYQSVRNGQAAGVSAVSEETQDWFAKRSEARKYRMRRLNQA